MIATYACTLLIVLASLAIGRAILVALGGPRPTCPMWLSGATGFAALVVAAPLLLRLPGRATTALIVIALVTVGCAYVALRDMRERHEDWIEGLITGLIVALVAAIPFAIAGRTGVLGEGIYTNDHAAQLYWADWLQRGFGPEPSAVRFGYPTGPQSVAVLAAQATGASLVNAFNGLLLAIPVLTSLTALGGLTRLRPVPRVAAAIVVGLPYLGASFLAQSAFKETAMALFILAFALAMATRSGLAATTAAADDEGDTPRWRLLIGVGIILGLASVFTFSVPGLAWFAIALPLWLIVEAVAGRSPVDWGAVRTGISEHKVLLGVVVLVLVAAAAVAFSPAREFANKIADVQASAGRLSSPVFPGEALGIWPAGDFRLVRGDVSGSLFAVAIGAIAIAYGAWFLLRLRQFALLSMLVTGGIVYVGTRLFAEIHVQAKALMVIAPLVLLVALAALLEPGVGARRAVRYGFGVLVLVAALLSTLLALRDAPIGFDNRQSALERLAEEADGHTLAFLGVDRFSGYYLRDTLMRAPAGYVPQEIKARPEKTWQQGLAADFDTLAAGQLDKFQYAITTDAAFASTPPPNFERVDSLGDYVLWKRNGETPRSRVLKEEGKVGKTFVFAPGAYPICGDLPKRSGSAVVIPQPETASYSTWDTPVPPKHTAAGQGLGWEAPGTATNKLSLRPGQYDLSLQYHSQVALDVIHNGQVVATLPPSLDGMYLSGSGRGAYWSAGQIEVADGDGAKTEITVRAADPGGLAGALGAPRRVWLGDLAASSLGGPQTVDIAKTCNRYVDHYTLDRGGAKGG